MLFFRCFGESAKRTCAESNTYTTDGFRLEIDFELSSRGDI